MIDTNIFINTSDQSDFHINVFIVSLGTHSGTDNFSCGISKNILC